MFRLRHFFPLLTSFFLVTAGKAKTDFNDVGQQIVFVLQNGHYEKLAFDDAMSERILEDYINFLDPQHIYFTQPQIDTIREKYLTELDNLLVKADSIEAAVDIYNTFYEQVKARVHFTTELLKKEKFTFDTDESIAMNREDAPWPGTEEDAQKLWTLHAKAEVLADTLRRESIKQRADEMDKDAETFLDDDGSYEKVTKRYERILKTYTDFDDEDVANFFFSTVASAYDPHSDYYSKRESDEFRSNIGNTLIGIGALLSAEDDGSTLIKGIVPNGPAFKQGELQLNDRIVGVDSKSDGNMTDILFMPLNKVVSLIRGEKNSTVTLKVEPADGAPGDSKLIKIDRELVEQKESMVQAKVFQFLDQDGNPSQKLGWMKIPSFYIDFATKKPSVAKDVEDILVRMDKENVDGLIIDMQGNGGGSLDEVTRITGLFTGKGPVVQVKDSLQQVKVKNSYNKKPIFTKPVVVHIDRTSASASEILAAALQDYGRAVVIGGKSTYGKGTVQQPIEIGKYMKWFQDSTRAGMIKPTIQKFYRISGGSTQLKGVESDIVLPSIIDGMEIGESHAKHALAWDEIPASNYETLDTESLFIPQLLAKSQERVKQDPDFNFVLEETKRTEERIEKNETSLNIEVRRKEIAEAEARRKTRIKEQSVRYPKVQKEDESKFIVYRLHLEDLEAEKLPLVDKDSQAYMIKAEEKLDELNDAPEPPSDLDPAEREALYILSDLVTLTSDTKTAKLSQ